MANLASHAQFFDRLVDLVPPKYYHASDQELVNTKYLKKNAKAAAKQAMKQQGKQNKRAKLNPDIAQTSLQIQQQHAKRLQRDEESDEEPTLPDAQQAAASQSTAANEEDGPAKTLRLPSSAAQSETGLQQKLQQRLQKLRDQRHADDQTKHKGKPQGKGRDAVKQKLSKELDTASAAKAWRLKQLTADKAKKRKVDDSEAKNSKRQRVQPGGTDSQTDFQFGKVEVGQVGSASWQQQKGKKKKPTKEQLLQEAMHKQREQQDAQPGAAGAQGQGQGRQEAWKAALNRARGEKVLDDPKLLKRSMKKEAKLKEKKSNAWKQRQGEQKQAQAKKQKKRQENLQGRADTKKAHKIEKREKKLMRAGFEGRRSSFINA